MENVCCVCPSLERLDLVRELVQSFQDCTPEPRPRFIVVASGRDDGTEGWCKNQGFEVVRSEQPLTYAQAVNLGAKTSDAEPTPTPGEPPIPPEWLLLLNNDLTLQPGFWDGFQEMVDLHYDIIAAKLLYPNGTIQHYGKWFTLDFHPFHVLRYQPADHPMAQQIRPFPDVTFACVAIRREVWEDLHGLDEDYSNGYEDDSFCLQARTQGAQIGVHPKMLAIHKESQSTGLDTANKEMQFKRFHEQWIANGRISWPLGIFQGWAEV